MQNLQIIYPNHFHKALYGSHFVETSQSNIEDKYRKYNSFS